MLIATKRSEFINDFVESIVASFKGVEFNDGHRDKVQFYDIVVDEKEEYEVFRNDNRMLPALVKSLAQNDIFIQGMSSLDGNDYIQGIGTWYTEVTNNPVKTNNYLGDKPFYMSFLYMPEPEKSVD